MVNHMSEEKVPPVKQEVREGFLNRWSARKRGDTQQDVAVADKSVAEDGGPTDGLVAGETLDVVVGSDESPLSSAELAKAVASPAEVQKDAPLLSDDDMPPIQSLSSDSDLSDFFNKGVSAALRKAALRHVFQQPKYNVRDGLNDYDGDYTVFEPLGDTITSDMKWHTARKERDRLEKERLEAEKREALAREELEELDDEASEEQVSEQEQMSHEQSPPEDATTESRVDGAEAKTLVDEPIHNSGVEADMLEPSSDRADEVELAHFITPSALDADDATTLIDGSTPRQQRVAGKLARVQSVEKSEAPALPSVDAPGDDADKR